MRRRRLFSLRGYSDQLQAVIHYASLLGYTLPTYDYLTKLDTLIQTYVDCGAWAKHDYLAVHGQLSADTNFSRINLVNPSYTPYSYINSVNVSKYGSQGNGIDSYIDTNFNPARQGVNYQSTNASRYLWIYSPPSATTVVLDGISVASRNVMSYGNSQGQRINQDSNATAIFLPFNSADNFRMLNITAPNTIVAFVGTTEYDTSFTGAGGIRDNNQYVHRSGTSYGDARIFIHAMGASMVAEALTIRNAINTFINAI